MPLHLQFRLKTGKILQVNYTTVCNKEKNGYVKHTYIFIENISKEQTSIMSRSFSNFININNNNVDLLENKVFYL